MAGSETSVRGASATPSLLALLSSSVSLKAIMAVTGFVWLGFLVGHLGTNIRVFGGAGALNAYYAQLESNTTIFWGVRILLASSVLTHILAAVTLIRRNTSARPVAYAHRRYSASTFASRTMRWTGPLIGLFILYHLLHLTVGSAMPANTTFVEGDQYANLVSSFSVWYVAAIYIASIVMVGIHLWHGAWSATRSLGVSHPSYAGPIRAVLMGITLLLTGGMLSIPLAIVAGLVR